MKERTIFIIYTILIFASFAPFFSFFQDKPLLTIGWILCNLFVFVFLTAFVYLNGYFENTNNSSEEIIEMLFL